MNTEKETTKSENMKKWEIPVLITEFFDSTEMPPKDPSVVENATSGLVS
jgi:hypothetical protein